jgi:hypothetical protein
MPNTGTGFGSSYSHRLVSFCRPDFYHSEKIKANKEYPITKNEK